MKCSQCGKKLETTFLNKPVGTAMKKEGKQLWLCADCQRANASADHEA